MKKNNFKVSSLSSFINLKELGLTGEEEITRKTMLMKSNVSDTGMVINPDEEKTIIAEVTNTGMDFDNEVIYTQGIDLSVFSKIPTIYWNHNYSTPPVGKGLEISSSVDKMHMKIKIADTTFAQEIWKLLQGGFLKSCSIGFITKSKLIKGTKEFTDFVKEKSLSISDKVQTIVKECILIENSIVGMPCNSDALVTAISSKSLKVSDEVMKELNLKGIELPIDNLVQFKNILKEALREIIKDKDIMSEVVEKVDEVVEDEVMMICPECKYEAMGKLGMKCPECDVEMIVKAEEEEEEDTEEPVTKAEEVEEVMMVCTECGYEVMGSQLGMVCPECEKSGRDGELKPKDPEKTVEPEAEPKMFKVIRSGWNKDKEIKDAIDILKGRVV